jgi:hypothetical protein
MVWDPTHEAVLLFGGGTPAGLTRDLDAWDGSSWSRLAADGPQPRDDALLVADPRRGVVVLFGGRAGERVLNDTWEWDGAAWTQVEVDGPPPRIHAAAAFDAVSRRVILYGGSSTGDEPRLDTWAWDGSAWSQIGDTGIPGLVPTRMAWDPVLGQVVTLAVDLETEVEPGLYGSQLFGWTGKAWKRVGDGPPPFSPLQSFIEGPRHPMFVDGGALQNAFTTWEWSGAGWERLATGGPSPRNGQSVAFDAKRHELVLFGGFLDGVDLGDTGRLSDGAWHEVRE